MAIPTKQEELDQLDAAREAAVMGGKMVEVTHRDGKTEKVHVRLLPIRRMPEYERLTNQEAECIELFCAQQEGWADGLTEESHLKLLQAGEDLNLRPLSDYLDRKAKRLEILVPGVSKQMLESLVAAAAAEQQQQRPPKENNRPATSPTKSPN